MMSEITYFAYGSNLSHTHMGTRCPGSEPVSPARLFGYRLTFAGNSSRWGGAVADIRPDDEWYVQGGIYRMKEKDLAVLDHYEGYPDFYDREIVKIELPAGDFIEAWAYRMAEDHEEGIPSLSYLETIIQGFFDFGITPPPEISAAEYLSFDN